MDILHLDIETPNEGKATLWYFVDNALIHYLPKIAGSLLIKNRSCFNVIFRN